jgi:hypothetical protein
MSWINNITKVYVDKHPSCPQSPKNEPYETQID